MNRTRRIRPGRNFEAEPTGGDALGPVTSAGAVSRRLGLATGLLLALAIPLRSSAAVQLRAADAGDAVAVSWTSQTLSGGPPFLHYQYQLQVSSNLVEWRDFGGTIPGGVWPEASISYSIRLAKDSPGMFSRLLYQFTMPGANLSGMDLSGADLRNAVLSNANLTGANLTGADLSGATLTGANLSGATLAGANLGNVTLDGLDLSGVDLSAIRGMPQLNRLNGPLAGEAAALLPHLLTTRTQAISSGQNPACRGFSRSAMAWS
jgi:hypothetical protein